MATAKPKKRRARKQPSAPDRRGCVKVTIEEDVGLSKRQLGDLAKAFRATLVSSLEGKERTREQLPTESLPPQVIYVRK